MSSSYDDYDTPWKDALTRYFHDFVSFYFPPVEKEIDWDIPCEFLEQELSQVTRDARIGTRRVDKLVRVARHGSGEHWVYVHVDVQGNHDSDFAERVFVYNYRIFDRYRQPVASLALLADTNPAWRPASFEYALFGCEMGIRFPIAKLSDYGEQGEALLDHPNPFALVTAAHLLTQRTHGDDVKRYALKSLLVQKLYERGWDVQLIVDLFNFIDWMMRLPDHLESKLLDEIEAYEREHDVAYISSFERRGLERGRKEGLQEGRQAGRREGQSELVASMLARRFGTLPKPVQARLATASPTELQAWGEALLDAPTLDSVFATR